MVDGDDGGGGGGGGGGAGTLPSIWVGCTQHCK
jgi:hypothetical protein